jgi:hypothetical protein
VETLADVIDDLGLDQAVHLSDLRLVLFELLPRGELRKLELAVPAQIVASHVGELDEAALVRLEA